MNSLSNMPLWNDVNLHSPEDDFCSYEKTEQFVELMSILTATLIDGAKEIGSVHPLWNEIQVFQVLLRRMAGILPFEKYLHFFQRVGRCAKNFSSLNISMKYLDLSRKLLSGIKCESAIAIVPSRQQLEFVLIRTQGAAMLISQLLDFCQKAFLYLKQRLAIGQTQHFSVFAAAAIARLSMLFKVMLLQLCNIYKAINDMCCHLKQGTWCWREDPKLPADLWEWVNPEFSIKRIPSVNLNFLDNVFKPESGNNESVLSMGTTADIKTADIRDNGMYFTNTPSIDIGEVQPRESYRAQAAVRTQIPKKVQRKEKESKKERQRAKKEFKERKREQELEIVISFLQSVSKVKRAKSLRNVLRHFILQSTDKKHPVKKETVEDVVGIFRNFKKGEAAMKAANAAFNRRLITKELVEQAKKDIIYKLAYGANVEGKLEARDISEAQQTYVTPSNEKCKSKLAKKSCKKNVKKNHKAPEKSCSGKELFHGATQVNEENPSKKSFKKNVKKNPKAAEKPCSGKELLHGATKANEEKPSFCKKSLKKHPKAAEKLCNGEFFYDVTLMNEEIAAVVQDKDECEHINSYNEVIDMRKLGSCNNDNRIKTKSYVEPSNELKPVKSLSKFYALYRHLRKRHKLENNITACSNLKQSFLNCVENGRLLQENGNVKLSKKLIFKTSKKMLAI